MNKKNYEWDTCTEVKKIWVCWDAHFIADSYEEAFDYSINNGIVATFDDWLAYYYTRERIFEMTEDEKKRVKAEYSEFVKERMADEWTEREIVF